MTPVPSRAELMGLRSSDIDAALDDVHDARVATAVLTFEWA